MLIREILDHVKHEFLGATLLYSVIFKRFFAWILCKLIEVYYYLLTYSIQSFTLEHVIIYRIQSFYLTHY